MTFWAEGRKPRFADAHRLEILVDSEILDAGDARYVKKSGAATEYLNFQIPRDYLTKIARGRDAQIKIGTADFKFKPEHLRLLANLLAVSSPAAF